MCLSIQLIKNICSCWTEKALFHGKWSTCESIHDHFDSRTSEFSFVIDCDAACSTLIGLMQKCKTRRVFDHISFNLYRLRIEKLDATNNKIIKSKYLESVGSYDSHKARWEVTKTFHLTKGTYIVVPVRRGRVNSEFILRVFTGSLCET